MNQNEEPSHPYGESHNSNDEVTPPEFMNWIRNWLTNPTRKRFTWVEIINIVLTAVIAAAALGSAWIFEGQLTSMNSSAQDAERDARITRRYARQQVNALQGQVVAIQRQMEISERAWVGIIGVFTRDDPGDPASAIAEPQIQNTGHSPARKVRFHFYIDILRGKEFHFPNLEKGNVTEHGPDSVGVMFPGPPTAGRPINIGRRINLINLARTNQFVYVFGIVTYEDIFHTQHWTHFCDRYDGDVGRFAICDTYNDADQN